MGIVNQGMRFVGPAILPKVSHHRNLVDSYTKFFINERVEEKTVLYESRDGQSMTDSPLAIFEYLLQMDKDMAYTHIWSITKNDELEVIKQRYEDRRNVLFVYRNSKDYLKWLAKAEFLINNSTFQSFVTIKENQTYINTWHGTPLKTMGFDIPGNPADAKNVVRNFFMADYLISPNHHTTEMFLKSYRLNENFPGKIIETGYPRIDQTFSKNKDETLKLLFDFGVEIDLSKKILLYTPTCKTGDLAVVTDEVAQIHQEMSLVREKFGDSYNVLIKVHPFLYKKAKKLEALKKYLVPDVLDTNKILGLVDCLVTDYSSIFFDFLVTNKPILFYCWDDDLYSNQRGKYFEYEELPGPVSFNIDELIHNIERLDQYETNFSDNYQLCQNKFTAYEDGHVTKRVVDIIFNQESLPNVSIIESETPKKSLLIYPGGMRSNGITSSFLNLMNGIDYSKYQVVCLLDNIQTPDQIKNISAIPKEVSLLFRFEVSNYTIKEHYQDLNIHLKGVKKGKEFKYPGSIYQREVNRLLGSKRFDIAIDFSGYSLHWSKIILAAKASQYICYLHSDMKLDQERVVNGKKIHKMNLQGIFSVYNRYDKLVSVSEAISQVNREKLNEYAPAEKFVYATNTINIPSILKVPSTEKRTQQPQTEMCVREATVLTDGPIDIATTRPDMLLGTKQQKVIRDKQVMVLGKFNYQDQLYYKISHNNTYLGWVKADVLSISPVSIMSEKTVSSFGKLNTNPGDVFYTAPLGLQNSIPLSSADDLRNVYVEIHKEIITQEGSSVLVKIKGKEVGWLPKNKVKWSSKLNSTRKNSLLIKLIRKLVMMFDSLQRREALKSLKTKPLKKESFKDYFENNSDIELIAFDIPSDTQEGKSIGKKSILYVESLSTNTFGRWYEIVTESGQRVWIKENQLSLTGLSEEVIIREEVVDKEVVSKEDSMIIYPTFEDACEDTGKVVRNVSSYQAVKQVETNLKRVFIELVYNDKKIWVKEEDLASQGTEGIQNASGELIPFPDKSKLNIVTTGRLSQEKNQVQLIEAFATFFTKYPSSHLYIIGSGPEENNLRKQIQTLGLEKNVTLMGQVYYPFYFMKQCDIFALTSLYEGQSIVLLEALTLEMKCLSTDIPACRNVLKDGEYGLITKSNDVLGIVEGLEKIATMKTTDFSKFDPYFYNNQSLEMFYNILN